MTRKRRTAPTVDTAALLLTLSIAITYPSGVDAQGASPSLLWRDLAEGDSADVVASKMVAMPEVKSAQAKGGSVKITYKDGGIPIFGNTFRAVPQFDDGGSLRSVLIGTDKACITDMERLYRDYAGVLAEKYPTSLSPVLSDADLRRAARSSTEQQPSTSFTAFTNGQTVAVFAQIFSRVEAPPTTYVSGKFARAASSFLRQQYEQRAAECNGTGLLRVQWAITYMSKAAWESEMAATRDAVNSSRDEARSGL